MIDAHTPTQIAAQLVTDTRRVASRLPFEDRAALVRDLVNAIRDAVKFDPHRLAPTGTLEELERLSEIGTLTENYADDACVSALHTQARIALEPNA